MPWRLKDKDITSGWHSVGWFHGKENICYSPKNRGDLTRVKMGKSKEQERYVPSRKEEGRVAKSLGQVKGSCERDGPRQVDVAACLVKESGTGSDEHNRQWQNLCRLCGRAVP